MQQDSGSSAQDDSRRVRRSGASRDGSSRPHSTTGNSTDAPGSTAATIQDILSTLFALQSGGGPSGRGEGGLTLQDLNNLLAFRGGPIQTDFIDEDEIDDGEYIENNDDSYYYAANPSRQNYFDEVKTPQEPGLKLLRSGDFGRVSPKIRSRHGHLNLASHIYNRVNQSQTHQPREDYANNLLPNTNGTAVSAHEANIYTGQYSTDSSFYYTCSQDFRLHIFDTTSMPQKSSSRQYAAYHSDSGLRTNLKVIKTIQGHPGRWTITDANLSPDNQRMIYSSITSTVYMASTLDNNPIQTPIPFADSPHSRGHSLFGYADSFGIWSCRFSADGNEVVAGGSGNIFVYDLLANRRTVRINAHDDDVNSCCWADTSSGNVLVSASDDTFLKVWDRRSLGAAPKPSGVLIGHTEGITYVSAKGDGRYVISNGKDQALRLWDLRMMRSNSEYEQAKRHNYSIPGFDYRHPHYPRPRHHYHPKDCSVMTYRGHHVLRTLIRCHFSPVETTGNKYLYSGSSDGRVHIWSLDGRVVQVLDRTKTLSMSTDPSAPETDAVPHYRSEVCVRDVSWHSHEPVLMSAGWESSRGGSIVARHEWKGLTKFGNKLEDWVAKIEADRLEGNSPRRTMLRTSARQHVPGAFYESENNPDFEESDEEENDIGDDSDLYDSG